MLCRNVVVAALGFWLVTTAAAENPDLTGRVLEPDGQPIKDASVFIYTAGPRLGPGYI